MHAPDGIRTHIPASELPQTYTLDTAETRIGLHMFGKSIFDAKEEKRIELLACVVEFEQITKHIFTLDVTLKCFK